MRLVGAVKVTRLQRYFAHLSNRLNFGRYTARQKRARKEKMTYQDVVAERTKTNKRLKDVGFTFITNAGGKGEINIERDGVVVLRLSQVENGLAIFEQSIGLEDRVYADLAEIKAVLANP